MGLERDQLEKLIRQLIEEELAGGSSSGMDRVKLNNGLISVKGKSVKCEKFDTGNPTDQINLKDVVDLKESPNMGAGYMEIINGKPFKWSLSYDEFDIILDGTLEIQSDQGTVRGSAGDTLFIPKGSNIVFNCPEGEKVRFVYVTYPADWQ